MSDAKLAIVDSNFIEENIDTGLFVLMSKAEIEKNNYRKVELMFAVGFESRPAKTDKLIVIPFGGSQKNLIAIGSKNDGLAPLDVDGESRMHSTNEAGDSILAFLHMNYEGKILIECNDDFRVIALNDLLLNASRDIKANATNEMVLQNGSDYAVRFSAIEALINQIESNFNFFINNTYNLHVHAGVGVPNYPIPVSNPISLDPAPMKIDDIRVP